MARKSRKNVETAASEHSATNAVYNAAAYIRLSSDDKKKRGDSLETQRNIIENYIASSPDVRLYSVYSDNNTTGTNFERPGFQKMLLDAECGKINCIIVKDLTRFGRNAIDAGYYLQKYLPTLGVRFIAVTDGFDTNDGDGGILLPLKNMISESYALDISRKCRTVQRQNIQEGRFVGRMAPFGYAKAEDDCRKLIIDEEAAEVVRMIYDWAYQGLAASEIVRRLNNAKIITPGRYKMAQGIVTNGDTSAGAYWQQRTVKSILTDSVYTGDMVQGKTRKVNGKQLPVSLHEWVCVPDTHEAIIPRKVFEAVQATIAASSDSEKCVSAPVYHLNIFRGKVYCANCGHAMHRKKPSTNGTHWFRCESQWKYAKDACVPVSVREEDLKSEIMTLLHKQSEAISGRLISLACETSKPETNKADAELREINQGLDKDGRMLRSLYESMVGGMITAEEFSEMKAAYEARIKALSDRADMIRNARRDAENLLLEYRDFNNTASAAVNGDGLNAEIVGRLVEKILIYPDKSIEVCLRYSDEFKEVSA